VTLGPEVRFATSGPQRLRVQNREDGFFIDHVVLSPSTYLTSAPGDNKNDTTILFGTSSSAPDMVVHAASAKVVGAWRLVSDTNAASNVAAVLPNAGRAKVDTPLASPADYFEVPVDVVANTPYRLWLRGRADGNSGSNDSVFAQFTNSVNASGAPAWRIGSASGVGVNLEDCRSCGNAGWGWEDNGWGTPTTLGPEIRFATSGTQRVRVQNREDGFFIDQIVLSPADYLSTAPGANKNDATILEPTVAPPTTPTVTLVRVPYFTVFARSAVIVWATRESGAGSVRIDGRTVAADTRLVPTTVTGMSINYYQHEARVSGLDPGTTYAYEAWVGNARAATASLKTAPQPGTGSIRFIAFGDSGVGTTPQRTVASRIAADTWDFALHTGDLAYGVSTTGGDATYQTYHSWFFDIYRGWLPRRPFFPSMGNHDGRSTNGYGTAYRDLFVLPETTEAAVHDDEERYYTFQYGPVQVFALDTERAFYDPTRQQTQLQWLESELASSTSPWKIAVFHKSPYSSSSVHGSELPVRQAFGPLFEKYGVQMAISGHDHGFERSVPWRESTNRAFQGVTYVVTGGAGAKLYPMGTSAWTARSASKHHYVRMDVSGCVLQFEAIGTDGVRFDRFTLDRCVQRSDAGDPTVRITSPANNATVSGVITVAVAATDDTRVEKVDLWVDGVWKALDRSSPYTPRWDSRSVPAGTHTLEARVYDLAGNKVRSAKVTARTTGS
jgi:hypothetical protein